MLYGGGEKVQKGHDARAANAEESATRRRENNPEICSPDMIPQTNYP